MTCAISLLLQRVALARRVPQAQACALSLPKQALVVISSPGRDGGHMIRFALFGASKRCSLSRLSSALNSVSSVPIETSSKSTKP